MLKFQQQAMCPVQCRTVICYVAERTPEKGGRGCHPLSPAVDHKDPGNQRGDFQIVCYNVL